MIAKVVPIRRMPLALNFLDYAIPQNLRDVLAPRQLVQIPFRSQTTLGIVHSLTTEPTEKKLKIITSIAVKEPLLSAKQLSFLTELAEFYQTPLGWLFKNCLPPLQTKKLAELNKIKIKPLVERGLPLPFNFPRPELFVYNSEQSRKEYIVKRLVVNKQTLILVPDIAKANGIFKLLPKRLQKQTLIVTSELGQKAWYKIWTNVWQGQSEIIIGTRRALWLPFNNLGTIIMDDEGNSDYKSWDMAPRFHARDAALMLAQSQGAQLFLLSSSPSVESYFFAAKNIYHWPKNNQRLGPIDCDIINLKDERQKKNFNLLSEDLLEAVINNKHGATFLYLNRRGSINYVACRDCGLVSRCPACQGSLTFHEDKKILRCHHCEFYKPMSTTCPNCRGVNQILYGGGTQQLEKELKTNPVLGNRTIQRIDVDEPNQKPLNLKPGDIIIGTQLAWNLIGWKKINLMAVVDVDAQLFVPEYKTTEELWQKINSARYNLPFAAKLFIQSGHLDHYLFQALTNPKRFYEQELKSRQLFGYPPFKYLLKLFAGFNSLPLAKEGARQTYQRLLELTKNDPEIKITPNLDAYPLYSKGKYWQVILVKLSYNHYKKNIKLINANLPDNWKVDPNPNTILAI